MVTGLMRYVGLGSQTPIEPPQKTAIRALPGNWYTSEDMYQLERRAIFSRRWLILTHKSRLPNPGDWLRYKCAGYDFIVAKDRSGEIHAYHNVCRHRAYPIVEQDSGNAKIFSCKYHGWSYGLKGNLAKAPGYQDLQGFDKSKNSLFPIHVRLDVNGFVWINMDSKEVPEVTWEEQFDNVDKQERYKEFNFDDYDFNHSWTMEGNFNWKILADNFNECYHCKTTHPDLPDIANLETYDVHVKADHIQHDPQTSEAQRAAGLGINSTYYFPYASMTVSPHFMFMQKFMPSGPTKSVMYYEVWKNRNSTEEQFQPLNTIYKRVMAEDKVLCERAQENINSGVFINGEMHPHMEKGPLFFQQRCREVVMEHFQREKQAGKQIWPAKQQLEKTGNSAISNDDVAFCEGLACGDEKSDLEW
ncbi:ISP domain-containing protein [Aaosphaeria arxii CBS 175.79]|uniref:Choline monooxygenase, chloroplastic n=1 Tax=Aaosphaeria arxii CBS 175.79 TaxID=1450172 RepID=A0A6A5XHX7_9PLEO|nr:ISP domain-containing protein [Aaosphaeria arxii CBS 175.79]KAF2012421.1 ISP domain-containing protein [Aaosphaeria arxii CBS 175.79]